MNPRTIGIIIRREFLNKVKKKSFLITTFLVPILVGAGMVAMIMVMMNSKGKMKTLAVVDRSSIVMPMLGDTETIEFKDCCAMPLDSVKNNLEALGYDGVLSISGIDSLKSVSADIVSLKPLGMDIESYIGGKINDAIESYRINTYDIEGLETIMKEVKADVKLNSYTIDEEGKETISESGVYAIISMLLGILIFLFVTIYGSTVMSAVIEEKSSRVVEVLVSSVKSTELMFGKIIGIALVALTQFVLWIILSGAIVSLAGSFMGKDLLSSDYQETMEMASGMGVDSSSIGDMAAASQDGDGLSVVLTTIRNMPLGKILLSFLIYFLFGYMLYASLFAAIGSAVENEGDTQQLQMPLTIPLMVAYIMAIYAFKAPDSSVAVWGSMIPFTSPIVMIARLPYGVPDWQLLLSIGLLVVTFVFCAWLSAKIYKVGILMFGKKSTWKDLWKWLKQN